MEFRHSQPGAVPAQSPEQWLADYLARRARLGTAESDFHCDPACTRPGCTIATLLVPVSLIDLMGVARHLQEPLDAVYQRYYTLGLLANERRDWIRKLSVRLIKPCPFLRHDLCSIYPVRPIACMLFPEYLACENPYGVEACQAQFRDFLCLRHPIRVTRSRAAIIRQLQNMWDQEELVSNYYLWKARQCSIDFGKVTSQLQEAAQNRPGAADIGGELPGVVPNGVMERFLVEHLADSAILGEAPGKIQCLAGETQQRHLLHLFQDGEVVRKIRRTMADVELTFRFKKGKLIRTRQNPLPGEYNFY